MWAGVCFLFVAIGIFILLFPNDPSNLTYREPGDMDGTTAAWLCILFFGPGGLFLIYNQYRFSRITVTQRGIAWRTPFFDRFWRWQDVGPFHLNGAVVQTSRARMSMIYMVAYSADCHRVEAATENPSAPTGADNDVKINLFTTPANRTGKNAQDFMERVNALREKHGGGA